MKPLVRAAYRTGEWDDAVAHFGAARGGPDLVYLGPMRANEHGATAPGLLVGTRDPAGAAVFEQIAAAAEELGERLFGTVCEFHGRVVEFYDIDLVAGPLRTARPAPIALFAPFYLGGWTDTDRQLAHRRTIMFGNVVASRFAAATRPAAALGTVLVDGRPPAVLDAGEAALRQAIAGWLCLHELMHGSGPAPFFAPWTGKAQLGDAYGVIEEVRVDMTAFLAAGMLDAGYGRLVQEMILLERLLRSARRGLRRRPGSDGAVALDDAHGLSWLNVLADEAMTLVDGAISIDMAAVEERVRGVLATVYEVEQEAAAAPDAREVLAAHGPRLRRELAPPAVSQHPVAQVIARLTTCPDAVSLEKVAAA